jgi:hypothetical protein
MTPELRALLVARLAEALASAWRKQELERVGDELAAALHQHCECHQAVTPGVRVERSAGG